MLVVMLTFLLNSVFFFRFVIRSGSVSGSVCVGGSVFLCVELFHG